MGDVQVVGNTQDVLRGTYGFGADTAADGIWHQFGTQPERPDKGIFLEIGDIPKTWLKYHYQVVSESSIYNNFDPPPGGPSTSPHHNTVQSLTDLLGFGEDNSTIRLGELANKRVIKEAVVAVPYILASVPVRIPTVPSAYTPADSSAAIVKQKQFINIPQARFDAALSEEEGTESGDSFDTAGASIRRLVDKMDDYVLPPKFDFLNDRTIEPIVMYIFEFKYTLDKDDLSYIWQNLAPRDYEKSAMQKDIVAHELFNTELLTEQNIMNNPNLRWMVFKVKQRSQKLYKDKIIPKFGTVTLDPVGLDKRDLGLGAGSGSPLLYNWPYDYLSIVELVKLEAEVLYRSDEIEIDEMLITEGFLDPDYRDPEVSSVVPSTSSGRRKKGEGKVGYPESETSSEKLKAIKRKAKGGDAAARAKIAAGKRAGTIKPGYKSSGGVKYGAKKKGGLTKPTPSAGPKRDSTPKRGKKAGKRGKKKGGLKFGKKY